MQSHPLSNPSSPICIPFRHILRRSRRIMNRTSVKNNIERIIACFQKNVHENRVKVILTFLHYIISEPRTDDLLQLHIDFWKKLAEKLCEFDDKLFYGHDAYGIRTELLISIQLVRLRFSIVLAPFERDITFTKLRHERAKNIALEQHLANINDLMSAEWFMQHQNQSVSQPLPPVNEDIAESDEQSSEIALQRVAVPLTYMTETGDGTGTDDESSETDNNSGKCCICYRKRANKLMLPCRHVCSCQTCLRGFVRGEQPVCPICRTPIQSVVELLFSR